MKKKGPHLCDPQRWTRTSEVHGHITEHVISGCRRLLGAFLGCSAAAKPEDAKLADAAAKARKAAEDAKAGTAIPETFKDYLDKWVYSVKDNDELLDKIGGSRLMRLKNEPHLGYSTRH